MKSLDHKSLLNITRLKTVEDVKMYTPAISGRLPCFRLGCGNDADEDILRPQDAHDAVREPETAVHHRSA